MDVMISDVNNISHIVGDLDRLPSQVRVEIRNAERRLTETLPPAAQAAFDAFHINGVEHKAYYVPQFGPDGKKRYVFGVLIY